MATLNFSFSRDGISVRIEVAEGAHQNFGFVQALGNRTAELVAMSLRDGVPEAIEARAFEDRDAAEEAEQRAQRKADSGWFLGATELLKRGDGAWDADAVRAALAPVTSTAVIGMLFVEDSDRNAGTAFFLLNGGLYAYEKVTAPVFESVLRAESIGRAYRQYIVTGGFPFARIDQ